MELDKNFLLLPSLLSADILTLGEVIENVIAAGADLVHLDIMDNHYVPNLSFSPHHCQAIHRRFPSIPIDVHLMVEPVDRLIEQFAKAGAARISIHPDASTHIDRSLQFIKECGCKAGLAINPGVSLECISWLAHRLDFILIMTVNPGFAGQQLIPEIIPKIADCHQRYPQIPICVDGGVDSTNINRLATAGAREFVAGTAVFHNKNYQKNILALKKSLGSNEG